MKTYPRNVLFGNAPIEIPDEETEKYLIETYENLEELFFSRIREYNNELNKAMNRFANNNYNKEMEQDALNEIQESLRFYTAMMDYLEKVSLVLASE